MSNHMSAKALRLWSQQVEGGRMRRRQMAENRAAAFIARRLANIEKGLEIKAEKRLERNTERAIGVFLFIYTQAIVITYLWWLLG